MVGASSRAEDRERPSVRRGNRSASVLQQAGARDRAGEETATVARRRTTRPPARCWGNVRAKSVQLSSERYFTTNGLPFALGVTVPQPKSASLAKLL